MDTGMIFLVCIFQQKVVDLCLSVVPKPDDTLIHQIALLSWVTPREVKD